MRSRAVRELAAAVAAARAEHITGEALAVDTHQHGMAVVDVALHEREMMLTAIDLAAVEMQVELAVVRGHLDDLLTLHEFLALLAIADEAFDGADLQAVLVREGHEFRQNAPWCRRH